MSSRKHILVLTSWYPNKNEPFLGNFIHQYAKALSKRHDVTLLYCDFSTKSKLGTEQTIINDNFTVCRSFHPSNRRIFRKYLASKIGLEYVVKNFQKVDLIHAQVGIRDWQHFLRAKKRLKCPLVYTEHGSYFVEKEFVKIHFLKRYGLKQILKFSDKCTAVSSFLAENINKQTNKPIEIIGNLVPNEWFDLPLNSVTTKAYRFLHISGMDENKNPQGILEASKVLIDSGIDDWQLTFVSEGDVSNYVKWTKENGLEEHIRFVEHLPHDELPKIYEVNDCFILNSYHETFSVVNAEALCFGLHLISTEVGFLVQDQSEFIDKIPCGNSAFLAGKMIEAIEKKKSSGQKGREFAKKFKEDYVLDQYEKLYNSLW